MSKYGTFGHQRFRCPSCWRFINEDDPVRRSADDLLVHADCPEPTKSEANL